MDRRAFTMSLFATAGSGLLISRRARVVAAQSLPRSVSSTWGAARDSGNDIDRFSTTITAHGSDDAAKDAFGTLLDNVQRGTLYSEETGAEIVGDASFFVRYDDPNFVVDEFVVLFSPLIYQFRSEAIHFGGARDAYRLMEEVFSRVDRSATSAEAIADLLPTAEEVAAYGLIEQLQTEATPTL
jgi:hypothetical protein